MGAFYDEIPTNIIEWIHKQHVFFVASAALRSKPGERVPDNRKNVAGRRVDDWGYVNVSPKEMALFNVVDKNTVWYQDLTGSGVETIAHMREPGNGKLTIMFVAFEGAPRICRLYGTGVVYERTSAGFEKYLKERPTLDVWARKRECLDLDIPYDDSVDEEAQIAHSNGTITDKQLALDTLLKQNLAETQGSGAKIRENGGLQQYWDLKNSMSLDGLPALSNLAPISGTSTPAPYGHFENSISAPKANGRLPVQKETFNRDEVRDIVMRERRRLSSNRWADLYVGLSILVLGLALGFGLREPIQRLFDML
ncbi:hypothetical protein QFC21_004086 [Naganishia friedmannii]|uniref:Uncharacterized protein n=1 Tax=Naganishia friedmannii TaxID=89922 RepID=A0ACC2VKS5_9TREE|nr:hypothetical protein QFC21_004086 [Naganishia friedmannii]